MLGNDVRILDILSSDMLCAHILPRREDDITPPVSPLINDVVRSASPLSNKMNLIIFYMSVVLCASHIDDKSSKKRRAQHSSCGGWLRVMLRFRGNADII